MRGRSERCIVSENDFCCSYSRARSIAIAAWRTIESASSSARPVIGRSGSSERSVSVASSSVGVPTGTIAQVAPRSRNGTSSSYEAPRLRAAEASRTSGFPARRNRLPGSFASCCFRATIGPTASSRRSSGTCTRTGTSSSFRSSGSRSTATSTRRSSTTERTTASSVASSVSSCTNDREISYSDRSSRAV